MFNSFPIKKQKQTTEILHFKYTKQNPIHEYSCVSNNLGANVFSPYAIWARTVDSVVKIVASHTEIDIENRFKMK